MFSTYPIPLKISFRSGFAALLGLSFFVVELFVLGISFSVGPTAVFGVEDGESIEKVVPSPVSSETGPSEKTPSPNSQANELEEAEVAEGLDMDSEFNRFRIDNTLTIREEGKSNGVKIETATLFGHGMVIDFIGDNDEIIIYDRDKKTFILLDPIHRVQTELSTADVEHFLTNLRETIEEKDDKFYRFILNPEFEISRNDESGELLFQSKWFDYRITTRSFDDPAISDDYFEFSDVYCMLNVYLNPGTFTPLARRVVNETLLRERRFPAQVHLKFYPNGKRLFAKSIEFDSHHRIIRRLSEEDHGRIVRAIHFSKQFQKMTFGNYYKTVTGTDPQG